MEELLKKRKKRKKRKRETTTYKAFNIRMETLAVVDGEGGEEGEEGKKGDTYRREERALVL